MNLSNLDIHDVEGKSWIRTENKLIHSVGIPSDLKNVQIMKDEITIEFNNAIAIPGLINSHDHLEFNLFPKLGSRKYSDFVEWGDDIHKNDKCIIEEILKVPINLRTEYGIYKNLINGVTTVVHHGNNILKNNLLINVVTDFNYLHSVRLEKNWKAKLNLRLNKLPYVIHIGEGTNGESFNEINRLIRWNLLNSTLIGIHGISMTTEQAESFKAVVWCPISNNFLYGSTCHVEKLKLKTNILFGTDSNVSADWNLWDHLRFARESALMSDFELYQSVTSNAAKIWNLEKTGKILPGYNADILIAEKNSENFFDSFYAINPENILMLIKNGKIILFDSELLNQMKSFEVELPEFSKIQLNGRIKFIKGRLNELCREIKSYSSKVTFPFEQEVYRSA